MNKSIMIRGLRVQQLLRSQKFGKNKNLERTQIKNIVDRKYSVNSRGLGKLNESFNSINQEGVTANEINLSPIKNNMTLYNNKERLRSMKMRVGVARAFGRGLKKKDKTMWQEYDMFMKEYRMPNYLSGQIAEDEVMDDFFTPEILNSMFKAIEVKHNQNRLNNPRSLEDKKRLGECMMDLQYLHVRPIFGNLRSL